MEIETQRQQQQIWMCINQLFTKLCLFLLLNWNLICGDSEFDGTMDLPLSDHHRVFTPFILERLQKAGITNAQQFLQSRNDRLSQISGLPLRILTQVREAILKRLVVSVLRCTLPLFTLIPITFFQDSSVDLSKSTLERPQAKYPTGIVLLDDLLHGGFEGGSINEFIGFTSCGKTYLTQSICLRLLYGHDQLNALIITNSPAVSGSLRSILECQNIDSDVSQNNIH